MFRLLFYLLKGSEKVKSILVKVLLSAGTVLLIVFLGGLVLIYNDYYTNTLPSYASYPISVPIIIHGAIFLIPSILCFVISFTLVQLKAKNKC